MTVSIVGTNGLLATELGLFCNENEIRVRAMGRREPSGYSFDQFVKTDLSVESIDVRTIINSDVIYYTAGAGIQSNLKDSATSIYHLNSFVPVTLSKALSEAGYMGTFVTFGSCFEIGNNNKEVLFTENEVASSMLDVPNDYCISKRLLTRYVVSASTSTFKHLHVILPTIYGEKEAAHRLIPYTVASIKSKLPTQFTQGLQIRQYLYAGDIPAIVNELIALGKSGILNIAGNETYSVRKVVEMIYGFYGIETTAELFGKAERADVGMMNLQLDDFTLKKILPNAIYTTFTDSLKIYDKCL